MISRVIQGSNNLFKYLTKVQLFCTSDIGFRSDRKLNQQILTVQGITDFRSITQYIAQKPELSTNDIKIVSQKLLAMKNYISPSDNLISINQKLKHINFQNIDIQTLSSICGIVPIINQNQAFAFGVYQKIFNKVSQYLKQPQKLSDQNIIRFLQVMFQSEKYKAILPLLEILKERIGNLKFKDYYKYLGLVNKRKLPLRQQKQIFNLFVSKVQNQLTKTDARGTINLYKNMKTLNPSIYRIKDVLKNIQQKLMQHLDDLEQSQIFSLLDVSTVNNKFNKIIYNKVLQAIEDNGQSSLSSITIFKILVKVSRNQDIRLYGGQKQAKMLKFLQKNLDKYNFINQLIRHKFLTRNQLAILNKSIIQNDAQGYRTSYQYLYQVMSRGAAQPDFCNLYLQQLKNQNVTPIFSERYITSILLLDKILQKDRNSITPEFADLRNSFIKGIQEFTDINKIKNSYTFKKPKILQIFSRKYGHLFINSLIQKNSKQNGFHNNLFNFLILSNDFKTLAKILKTNPTLVSYIQQRALLQRVNSYPQLFKQNFEIINKLFLEIQDNNRPEILKRLVNYLCNWQVHLLLTPDQISSFLKLARHSLTKINLRNSNFNDFISYFIKSPASQIRNNVQYTHLLQQLQNFKQKANKKKPQQQVNSTKNQDETKSQQKQVQKQSQSFFSIKVANQAKNYNILNASYIQQIRDRQKFGALNQYYKIMKGQKFNHEKTPITAQNLHLLTKCRNIQQTELSLMVPQIKTVIQKSGSYFIQAALMNFQMRNTKSSIQIYKALINKYSEFIKQQKYVVKSELLLKILSQKHITVQQYRDLLKNYIAYYSKHIPRFSTSSHALLLAQATNNNVESVADYAAKLLNDLQGKAYKYDLSSDSLLEIIPYLILHNAESTIRLAVNLARQQHSQFLIRRLFRYLNIFDANNQVFVRELKKYIQHSKQPIEIDQATFNYLESQNKEFAEIKDKIKFGAVKEPVWLKNKLIKFCQLNNIPFEVVQKFGQDGIKIGQKYIFCTHRIFSPLLDAKLKKFYSFLLGNVQKQFIHVFYLNKLKFRANQIAHILSQQFSQFKEKKNQLHNFIRQKQHNQNKQLNETQSSQNASEKSPEIKSNKSQKKKSKDKSQNKQKPQKKQQNNSQSKDGWQN